MEGPKMLVIGCSIWQCVWLPDLVLIDCHGRYGVKNQQCFFFTAVRSWGDKCCSDRPGQFCPKIHRLMAQDLWVHGNLGEETAYHSEADEISLNTAVGISWSFNIAIFFFTVSSISPYCSYLCYSSHMFITFSSPCFPHSYRIPYFLMSCIPHMISYIPLSILIFPFSTRYFK